MISEEERRLVDIDAIVSCGITARTGTWYAVISEGSVKYARMEATARRLSVENYGRIVPFRPVDLNNRTYIPVFDGVFAPVTSHDSLEQEKIDAARAAENRLRSLGATDEDIAAIRRTA
jgi:hypothetical protein